MRSHSCLRKTFDQCVQIIQLISFEIGVSSIEFPHWITKITVNRLHRALSNGCFLASICHRSEANIFQCIWLIPANLFNRFLQTKNFIEKWFTECRTECDRFWWRIMCELHKKTVCLYDCNRLNEYTMQFFVILRKCRLSVEWILDSSDKMGQSCRRNTFSLVANDYSVRPIIPQDRLWFACMKCQSWVPPPKRCKWSMLCSDNWCKLMEKLICYFEWGTLNT